MLAKLVLYIGSLPARALARARWHESKGKCSAADGATFGPTSAIHNYSGDRTAIRIGADTHIQGQLLVFANGGRIDIGHHCYVGELSRIWSMFSISIGDRVLISHGVSIHDNNAHSLSATDRHDHFLEIFKGNGHPTQLDGVAASPIVIEDDAWIGFNATILKGVCVGRGAIVGACAVVTDDVPAFSIVVGNPARIIGQSKP